MKTTARWRPMVVEHLDQVRPLIEGRTDFRVSRDPTLGYQAVDYVYATDDTFAEPLRLELRGLKFDLHGKVIARPLHKFFNLGETEQLGDLDFGRDHRALLKLDGSMVHPLLVGREWALMTRAGVSDVALQAMEALTPDHTRLFKYCYFQDLTPVFEYTSPRNRIVIRYDRPALTLLAVRHLNSGEYLSFSDLRHLATTYGVSLVGGYETLVQDPEAWVGHARALQGAEGYVLTWADGHRVKVKADEYVMQHRVRSSLAFEHHVLKLVLSGKTDDLLPTLDEKDQRALERYRDVVLGAVAEWGTRLELTVKNARGMTRKEFALGPAGTIDPRLRPALFKCLDGVPAHEALVSLLDRRCGTQSGVEEIRDFIGHVTWNGGMFALEDA